ncbi:gephyrin-like molybdotransferase Glp [Smaragdicoccus niigatensis]|uniref:molybdopterin molybdotransferase MoeA n=1 Tax=Smaragdicoccus niigatensis TaxID=359359 RepID=UPI00037D6CB5|nr:gephyrin-like molybdotransferase Glp [Smaragdicoccus niigatensis]
MNRRSVDQHAAAVAELLRPLLELPTESVPLRAALGRFLPTDVVSPIDLPNFQNSQMDGYAVESAAIQSVPVTLPVAGVIAAGLTDLPALPRGGALKIMTGAPIPAGADCIVPVEDTTAADGMVTVLRSRRTGEFVRNAGSDVQKGRPLVTAGTLLGARHVAALAAAGLTEVAVRRRPRVAVITTGTELVAAGTPLLPGQIYDSNGTALASSFEANGADVVRVAHSDDDTAAMTALLDECAATADVIVTSGGVSMGDFEVVKETLLPLGGHFGPVAMQPGGPQGLSVYNGVPVLSFPGNPVSTLVSFEVFARRPIRAISGLPALPRQTRTLTADISSVPGKRQFVRGKFTENGIEPMRGTGSHLVAGLAWADALISVPAEHTVVPAGVDVEILVL